MAALRLRRLGGSVLPCRLAWDGFPPATRLVRWSLEAPSIKNWVEALQAEAVSCILPASEETKMKILDYVMKRFWGAAILSLMLLSSCNKTAPGSGPHATVLLRDGTSVSGTVMSSSATEIQIAGDDKVSRTIPMSQVRSVDYDETAAAAPGTTPAPNAPSARAPFHDSHYHPAQSAITTRTHELPSGTEISVRNEETIDSTSAVAGQTFASEVTGDVLDANGSVVIPRGANAQIVIKSASKGGRVGAASDLVLDLASVSVDGRRYQLHTTDIAERGKSGVGINKRTAEFAGGGAAIGAIIGAIAGHGKGAAIGAGAGAGGGALAEILTKGGAIKVPVETVLTFRLNSPLRVVAAR